MIKSLKRPAAKREEFEALARFISLVIAFALLFFFSEAVRSVLLNPGGQGSTVLASEPGREVTQRFIFALCGVLVFTGWHKTIRAITSAWPFWIVSAVAVLSFAWSLDRAVSLRYGAWLTATALLGAHFDLRFSLRTQLRLLSAVLAFVIALSVVFIIWFPSLGIESGIHSGAWRGVFVHKNSLGRAMALAVLIFSIQLPGARRSLAFLLAAIAASLTLGWYARSATAAIILALLASLIPFSIVLRRTNVNLSRIALRTVVATAFVAWLAFENADTLLGAVGRDTSLSGRPLLWATLLPAILDRPVLGYGLATFWKGSSGLAAGIEKINGWNPGQAHNGFIDVAIDTGVVGIVAMMIALTIVGVRAVRYARVLPHTVEGLWPLGYLVFFVIANLTESLFLRPNSIYWLLFASVATRVMRAHPGAVQ